MSHVAKPGSAAAAPGGGVRSDAGERPAKGGEFEAVLKDKGQDVRAPRDGPHAAAELPSEAPRGRTQEAIGERGRGEADQWRALPGDLALPTHARFDPGGLAATDGARAAEAVARIERIAEQIVRALEVRLGPGGVAGARLELDLGRLGQLRVALDRSAEGALSVRFEGARPEAARLLVDHGAELVAKLEARGLTLREVVLASPEGPVVRLGPVPDAPAADASRRSAAEPGSSRQEADRGGPDDEQRRRPAETFPEEED
jgi:hypothetical protein